MAYKIEDLVRKASLMLVVTALSGCSTFSHSPRQPDFSNLAWVNKTVPSEVQGGGRR